MSIFQENIELKPYNTFGIEAKARWFAEYSSVEQLQQIITERQSMGITKLLHIGGGSNLLFLKDYDGIVIHCAIKGYEVIVDREDSVLLRVGAGVVFDDLIDETLRNGWYGLENLSLIPGEVGASAVQNIGAYGAEAKDFITDVELTDLSTGELVKMTNADCQYAYRYSIFKSAEMWGRYAVTHVTYRLSKTFIPRLDYGGLQKAVAGIDKLDAMTLRRIIIDMRQAKLPDTKVLGNAGSFFMNPIISRVQYTDLLAQYPDMPHYDVDENRVKVPAGWLIEHSGWKGRKLGQAGVYEKQALVLVNHGGCTGEDIVRLSDAVRKDVSEKYGIEIHPEVNFI